MGVKVTGIEQTMTYIEKQASKKVLDYLAILKRVGRKTVTSIRTGDASNWNDQTGNLRNSIGFIIISDGTVVEENFTDTVSTGTSGVAAGRKYAQELAAKYPKGYVLIIVAGMEYAAYVEAIEGKAVLAQGRLLAKRLHKELVAKYNAKAASRK